MSDEPASGIIAVVRREQHPDEYSDAQVDAAVPDLDRWALGNSSCGIACVHMVVNLVTGEAPDYLELVARGFSTGGFGPSGWVHEALVRLLDEHGVRSRAVADCTPPDLLRACSRGMPSIISCTHTFPEDGRRGGHLVVLLGERSTPTGTYVAFADPSRWGASHHEIESARFWASWSGRAIITEPMEEPAPCPR